MDKLYFEIDVDNWGEVVYRRALKNGKQIFYVSGATTDKVTRKVLTTWEREHESFDDYWNGIVTNNSSWAQSDFGYVHSEAKPFIVAELKKELQSHPDDNKIIKNILKVKGR